MNSNTQPKIVCDDQTDDKNPSYIYMKNLYVDTVYSLGKIMVEGSVQVGGISMVYCEVDDSWDWEEPNNGLVGLSYYKHFCNALMDAKRNSFFIKSDEVLYILGDLIVKQIITMDV